MGNNNLTKADIQERISRARFHQMLQPEVLEVDNKASKLKLQVKMCAEFERQPGTGQWHGGILASLIDIAGCYALMLVAKGPVLTLNLSTDFLRLATSETLVATARVRRAGRTIGFVDVDVSDDNGELLVKGSACYAIRLD